MISSVRGEHQPDTARAGEARKALKGGWLRTPEVRARLISPDPRSTQDGGKNLGGLALRLGQRSLSLWEPGPLGHLPGYQALPFRDVQQRQLERAVFLTPGTGA